MLRAGVGPHEVGTRPPLRSLQAAPMLPSGLRGLVRLWKARRKPACTCSSKFVSSIHII